MLQSMEFQRVGHEWETKQQQQYLSMCGRTTHTEWTYHISQYVWTYHPYYLFIH